MKKFARILSLTLVAVMLCAALASCGGPAKDPADAKAALEENGYVATNLSGLALTGTAALLGVDDLDAVVTGAKEGEAITIFYFETSDAADAAFEKIEEKAAEAEEEYEDMVCKQSGKMIWMGTKQAVKDAK